MGVIRHGPRKGLLVHLAREFSIGTFIETGTFKGATAAWAAEEFERVVTIELSRELDEPTVAQFGHLQNVEFIFGDSRDELARIVPELTEPALFWLDGHWSGGQTYGAEDQCPLLAEIEAINRSPLEHFLVIDDARLFESPPPKPGKLEAWPPLADVMDALRAADHDPYIVIFEDTIMAVPRIAQASLADYCQRANTDTWHAWLDGRRSSVMVRSGFASIRDGLRKAARDMRQSVKH